MDASQALSPRAWWGYLCGATTEQLREIGVDPDLVSSCTGEGDIFPALWKVAERYVRRGDSLYVQAGLQTIEQFALRFPKEEQVALLEWHFQPLVPWPNHPMADPWSYRAMVAVAVAGPDPHAPAPGEPAHRLVAMLGRIAATAPRGADRLLARQALRAIEQLDANWYGRRTSLEEALLDGRPMDPDLVERCATPFEEGRYAEAVREGMIVLEERVRLAGDVPAGRSGSELFSSVFNPNDPGSLNPGAAPAERVGFVNLFTGAHGYFRNPASHRAVQLDRDRCLQILQLVDMQLSLVYEGLTTLHSPEAFLSPGSLVGRARVERVVHIDLDGDGRPEKLIIFSGMTQFGWRGLFFTCLREDAAASWVRLPNVKDAFGQPFVRLLRTEVLSLDGSASQVAVWWDRGDGNASLVVLRLVEHQLGCIQFDNPFDPDYPLSDLTYLIGDGSPVFRETDSDGRPEIHALMRLPADSTGSSEIPLTWATFVTDPKLSRFSIAIRDDVVA